MNEIIILRSSYLIQLEGDSASSSGYKYSHHNSGVETTEKGLNDANIPYVIWEENEFKAKKNILIKQGQKIVVVPEMRVCAEDTFQILIECAENGWTIFSIYDSFYFTQLASKEPQRVVSQRIRELFQLSKQSDAETKWFSVAELYFSNTRFSWLTKGLPSPHSYPEINMLGVIGQSDVLSRHGEVHCVELVKKGDNSEAVRKESTFPAFIIREFDTGGLFIYACFTLRKIASYKRIFKNLYVHQTPQTMPSRQLLIMKIVILILSTLSGLLLAKELLGGSITNYLGGAIVGIILGYLGNKLTDLADRWIIGEH